MRRLLCLAVLSLAACQRSTAASGGVWVGGDTARVTLDLDRQTIAVNAEPPAPIRGSAGHYESAAPFACGHLVLEGQRTATRFDATLATMTLPGHDCPQPRFAGYHVVLTRH